MAAVEAPAPAAAGGGIVWPQGGFRWTDEWRTRLPVVRGVQAPPYPRHDEVFGQQAIWRCHEPLRRPRPGRDGRMLEQARADDVLDALTQPHRRLDSTDPDDWVQLLVYADELRIHRDPATLSNEAWRTCRWKSAGSWLLAACALLHGLALPLQVASRARQERGCSLPVVAASSLDHELRGLIAGAPDDEHARAMAWLEEHPMSAPWGPLRQAELCPHRADWAMACVASAPYRAASLIRSAVPLETALAWQRQLDIDTFRDYVPTHLVLQWHLHGLQAFPLLSDLLRRATRTALRKELIGFLLQVDAPETLRLLAELEDRAEAREALDAFTGGYAPAVLAARYEHGRHRRGWPARWRVLKQAVADPAAARALHEALGASERGTLETWLAELHPPQAPQDRLPPELVTPPWLSARASQALPELAASPRHTPWRTAFSDEARARATGLREQLQDRFATAGSMEVQPLERLGLAYEGHQALEQGQPLQPSHVSATGFDDFHRPSLLLALPDALALLVWNSYPPRQWKLTGGEGLAVQALVLRHGEAAAPGLVKLVRAHPGVGFEAAWPVDCAELVPVALDIAHRSRRDAAAAWLWILAHVPAVLAQALPLAFGPAAPLREASRQVLKQLLLRGQRPQVEAAAAAFGSEMAAALEALAATDLGALPPERLPRHPDYLPLAAMPRPRLRESGLALPLPAMEHLATMLMLGSLERPYPALQAVRNACTPDSMSAFSLALFEAWLLEGAPASATWAMHALAWLGDGAAVSRLAPLVRAWPGESAVQRALVGADVLAAIGTDQSLMHLHAMAEQKRFKPLAARALSAIACVGAARGLGADALADRLVPDLGLDGNGTLQIETGARSFSVGFDGAGQPFVQGADGRRLANLPRRQAGEDAERFKAAGAQLRQLKQDARVAADKLARRLQAAMATRRRWPAAEFQALFIDHPFARHVARRVVWGTYAADGRLLAPLRLAEGGLVAPAGGEPAAPPAAAQWGVVHPVELDDATLRTLQGTWAALGLEQPFPQLRRWTFRAGSAQRAQSRLVYAEGVRVTLGQLQALKHRGWDVEEHVCRKETAPGLQAHLVLRAGPEHDRLGAAKDFEVEAIALRRPGASPASFAELDDVTASELQRDLWRTAGNDDSR